tara:strand:- start:2923 stop:3324 length:402 start_codon:yes stop_codon:yes gene_type:complete
MSSTTNAQPPSGEGDAKTKEVAPPPPPGFEDVKAGAHLDEVAEVAEKLAKGENLGTKKEGTVDAPDASLKTGKLNWAEEVRRRSPPSSVDALCRRFFFLRRVLVCNGRRKIGGPIGWCLRILKTRVARRSTSE